MNQMESFLELEKKRTKGIVGYSQVADSKDGPIPTDPAKIGAICLEYLSHDTSGRPAWIVYAGPDEAPRIVAMTGNGPTSEVNAQWILACGVMVPELLAENTRLRKALGEIKDTARRQLEDEQDARLRSPYGLGCTHNLSEIEEMADAALSAGKGEG